VTRRPGHRAARLRRERSVLSLSGTPVGNATVTVLRHYWIGIDPLGTTGEQPMEFYLSFDELLGKASRCCSGRAEEKHARASIRSLWRTFKTKSNAERYLRLPGLAVLDFRMISKNLSDWRLCGVVVICVEPGRHNI
jgi:hypothetical protein